MSHPAEGRIAGAGRVRDLSAGAAFQMRPHRVGDARRRSECLQHAQRVGVGRRVGSEGARGENVEAIPIDVGHGEHLDPPGAGAPRELPARGSREVLAHRVQGVDRRSPAQQGVARGAEIREAETRGRSAEKRRSAARQEHEQAVTGTGGRDPVEEPLGRRDAALVGQWMRGLVHPAAGNRTTTTVGDQDEAVGHPVSQRLDGHPGEGGAGLAETEHEHPRVRVQAFAGDAHLGARSRHGFAQAAVGRHGSDPGREPPLEVGPGAPLAGHELASSPPDGCSPPFTGIRRISIRRFFARPSAESLSATGAWGP